MKSTRHVIRASMIGLIFIVLACASTSYINVRYQLQQAGPPLAAPSVYLSVEDQRPSEVVLNPQAREEMPNFRDLYALSPAQNDAPGKIAGVYDLTGLFYAALKKRLNQRGVTVVEQRDGEPVMDVILDDFRLELNNRAWTAHLGYRVSLSQSDQRVAKDTITGSAERTKIVGRRVAETMVGDIFSEVINRLNLDQLFQNAGL